MDIGAELLRVRALSDGELLAGLSGSLGVSRRAVAAVVAHLGEVEERRLHSLGGHGSLFAYCVSRLGMSEDEAWRRIEVARLVRSFPLLLEKLASGDISLSVAALLRSRLTEANHAGLLAEVSGKTVRQARELLARRFPQPDVLPLIRKLPAQREPGAGEGSVIPPGALAPGRVDLAEGATDSVRAPEPIRLTRSVEPPAELGVERAPAPIASPAPASRRAPFRNIEPLSADRYKLQLTAGTSLKGKLERAQDLLRHALPGGDLATIIERALDLLIEQTMKRRFGVASQPKAKGFTSTRATDTSTSSAGSPLPASESSPASQSSASQSSASQSSASQSSASQSSASQSPASQSPASQSPASQSSSASQSSPSSQSSPASLAPAGSPQPGSQATPLSASGLARYIPRDVRRVVHVRDGGRCTWVGADGARCECQAWLEYDHIVPVGRGGTSEAANIRLLCKTHNRLAAEMVYGRDAISRSIERRRRVPFEPAATPHW